MTIPKYGEQQSSIEREASIHGIPLSDSHTLAAFLLTNMKVSADADLLFGESLSLGANTHDAIKKSCAILNHALDKALNMSLPVHGDNSNLLSAPYALEETMLEDRRSSCFFLSEKGVLCFKATGRDVNKALPMQTILKVIKRKDNPSAEVSQVQANQALNMILVRMDEHISKAAISNDSNLLDARAEIKGEGRSR